MKKSLLTLLVGTTLALSHTPGFALTPLSEAGMKSPTAKVGVYTPINVPLDCKRITQVVYSDSDNIAGALDIQADLTPDGETPETSGSFSETAGYSRPLQKNDTDVELEDELPAIAIDEATRLDVLTTAPGILGVTNKMPDPLPNLIFHVESSLK